MIGLLGAHRVGKTTLARELEKRYGLLFVQTNVIDTFERLGKDPRLDYDMETRLSIQEEILVDIEQKYLATKGQHFVTDRTPLDLLAYTFADIQRQNMSMELTSRFGAYFDRCISVTNAYFWLMVLIQPGIPIVDEPGKAPPNIAYMEHLNLIMKGLNADHRLHCQTINIKRSTIDLQRRIGTINNALRTISDALIQQRELVGSH